MNGLRLTRKALALATAVALAATAVVTTGCGSKTSGSTETGGAKQYTYKIGVGMPLTQGATALGEGITRASQLAVKDANASAEAKKLGITFEISTGDDLGDPKTGVTVANFFASDPKVVGVMGHLNSGVCIPASKVYSDANLAMVSPAATNPQLTLQGLTNVFRLCTVDTVQGSFAAEAAAKTLGLKKAFVVDDSTPYGEGLASEFAKGFKANGGTVTGTEKTADKDSEFSALATKIKASGADVVYYGGVYNAGALLAKQMSDSGVTAPMMSGDAVFDPEYVKLAGAAQAEGDLVTSVGFPTDRLPNGKDFLAAYAAEYPDDEIGAYDAYAYDAAQAIIAAVLDAAEDMGADKVTSAAGRDAIIKAVAKTDMEGVTGRVAFDEKGDTLNTAITVYRVEKGAFVPYILPKE